RLVADHPRVDDALRAAGAEPRDGRLLSVSTRRVLDAHANRASVWEDGALVARGAALVPGARVDATDGSDTVEAVDVRLQPSLPSGLPSVETRVWRPGRPGVDEILVGHVSGEVESRRTLVAPGRAVPDPDKVVA